MDDQELDIADHAVTSVVGHLLEEVVFERGVTTRSCGSHSTESKDTSYKLFCTADAKVADIMQSVGSDTVWLIDDTGRRVQLASSVTVRSIDKRKALQVVKSFRAAPRGDANKAKLSHYDEDEYPWHHHAFMAAQ